MEDTPPPHPRTQVVHQNAGVDPRFRVVDAPLDLRFALVWGEFQHKVRHSEPGFVISPR